MHGVVVQTKQLTPSMVRVVMSGEGLAGVEASPYTDAYINIAVPPPDAPYRAPFDIEEVRTALPNALHPIRRRYSVRRWDGRAKRLTIDVVVHGGAGVGGRWAARSRPGDALVFTGPKGAYRPDPDADWHLMVGDESAVPAIAASLEAVPSAVPVVVRAVCDGPRHEVDLATPGVLDLQWLHREGVPADSGLLPAAVQDLTFRPGRVQAFVHGEAGEVREIRRHLLADRGIARADLSASPYWRRHLTDEAWREIKADWNAAVEHDVDESVHA